MTTFDQPRFQIEERCALHAESTGFSSASDSLWNRSQRLCRDTHNRKNWLFSGSPRGAAASAILYSLIETAKANRREPYWYLRELFENLPHARTRADYLTLLPTPRPPPPVS